jgi:hypothetical protein
MGKVLDGSKYDRVSLTTNRFREKKTNFASSENAREMRNKGVGGAQHLQADEKAAWRRRQKQPMEP